MHIRKSAFVLFCLITASTFTFSQQQTIPLNRQLMLDVESEVNQLDRSFHTGFKPYVQSGVIESRNIVILDTVPKKKRGLIFRKLKQENLIIVDTGDFYLTIDPLFNFEFGMDMADTSARADTTTLYRNTRGLMLNGDIGDKVSFGTSFYENQAIFPSYIDSFVQRYDVVPGQGRTKTFKTTGYDYAIAYGYVSIRPVKRLNIQLGHGKHFIGDGYRSLMLSDNAFNYPYLKITTTFGKFQYTNLFADFQNLNIELPTSATTERRFQRKIATVHHLSYLVNKWVELGLFEGMIWKSSKSNGRSEYDDDYLSFINPIIMVRPFQYGLNNENNVMVGLNVKVNLTNKTMLYAQAILDDNTSDKYGYQVGLKGYDLFKVKNLHFQTELNRVEPYTYGHIDSTRSFSHYNQAIAHPLGAGFTESVTLIYLSIYNSTFPLTMIAMERMYLVPAMRNLSSLSVIQQNCSISTLNSAI